MKKNFCIFLLLIPLIFVTNISAVSAADPSPDFYGVLHDIRVQFESYFKGFDTSTGVRNRDKCEAAALQVALVTMSQAWAEKAFIECVQKPLMDGLEKACGGTVLSKAFDAIDIYNHYSDAGGDPEEFAKSLAKDYIKKKAEDIISESDAAQSAYDAAKEIHGKIQEALESQLKNEFLDTSPYGAQCGARISGLWSKGRTKIILIIYGNCECRPITTSLGRALLEKFTVKVYGHTRLVLGRDGNYYWKGVFDYARVEAICCPSRAERPIRTYGPDKPEYPPVSTPTTPAAPTSTPITPEPKVTPTPTPTTPAVPKEDVNRLSDHAEKMKDCIKKYEDIKKEIEAAKKALQDNLKQQKEAQKQIDQLNKELEALIKKSKVHIYQDNRTGIIYEGYATGPNMVYKGWSIPPDKAKKIRGKKEVLKTAKENLKKLEKEAKDLQKKLKELEEELKKQQQKCLEAVDKCKKTSSLIRTAITTGWTCPHAKGALKSYDESAEKIKDQCPSETDSTDVNKEAQKITTLSYVIRTTGPQDVLALANSFILENISQMIIQGKFEETDSLHTFVEKNTGCLYTPQDSVSVKPKRIKIKLTVGAPLLDVGKITWGKFQVLNTTKKVKIHFINNNPGVVAITGGNEQTVVTSGGKENISMIEIKGLTGPRYYTIQYEFEILE